MSVRRRLYRVSEAADSIGASDRSVWRLVESGALKSVRVGRRILIPVEEIDRFIDSGGVRTLSGAR
jgi:excisionase family DNA binding protein